MSKPFKNWLFILISQEVEYISLPVSHEFQSACPWRSMTIHMPTLHKSDERDWNPNYVRVSREMLKLRLSENFSAVPKEWKYYCWIKQYLFKERGILFSILYLIWRGSCFSRLLYDVSLAFSSWEERFSSNIKLVAYCSSVHSISWPIYLKEQSSRHNIWREYNVAIWFSSSPSQEAWLSKSSMSETALINALYQTSLSNNPDFQKSKS